MTPVNIHCTKWVAMLLSHHAKYQSKYVIRGKIINSTYPDPEHKLILKINLISFGSFLCSKLLTKSYNYLDIFHAQY